MLGGSLRAATEAALAGHAEAYDHAHAGGPDPVLVHAGFVQRGSRGIHRLATAYPGESKSKKKSSGDDDDDGSGKPGGDKGASSIEFTTRGGRTVTLNNDSQSACIESCKQAPELKDANNTGGVQGLMGVATGGERQNIADCVNFCMMEHQLLCFPGDSTVVVHNRGRVPLSQLRVGDQVLAANPPSAGSAELQLRFDTVLAWLHRDTQAEAEVLQLQHSMGQVQLTANHLIFAHQQGASGAAAVPVVARNVSPGDRLLAPWIDGSLALPEVRGVQRVVKRGLYAPLLEGGSLLVDGTLASCYAVPNNLEASSAFRSIAALSDGAAVHAAAHALFLPLRLLCHATGVARPSRALALPGAGEQAAAVCKARCAKEEAVGVHPYAWFCYVTIANLVT